MWLHMPTGLVIHSCGQDLVPDTAETIEELAVAGAS